MIRCARLVAFTLLSTLVLFSARAQQQERNNARPAACDPYDKLEVPAADLPAPEERKALASCSSEDLYFGFGVAADPVKARKCAYLQREPAGSEGELRQPVFGGAGLLSMIYANGKGATRNFDLALKFACEVDDAPAENELRFAHLLKLQKENWSGDDFHLCDDITSGFMQGMCAGLGEKFAKAERNRKFEKFTVTWSQDEKKAFQDLQKEAAMFFETGSRNEVDLSGTARGAFVVEAEAGLHDGFLAALERFEKGQLPKFSAADFSKADAELNSTYAKLQLHPNKPIGFSTVTSEGIRTTQRAWLRYREAWVKFGKAKYPTVSADSWRTWLTQNRVKMLKDLTANGT